MPQPNSFYFPRFYDVKKIMDKEMDNWLREVRALPHNLDANGNSTIKAFSTFRVGQRLFFYDGYLICFCELVPELMYACR